MGEQVTPESYTPVQHELGLDQQAPVQYVRCFARVAQGDLGTSLHYGAPVCDAMAERLPASLQLRVPQFHSG